MAPALGIYATLVDVVGDDGRAVALARGATSVGTNPTIDASGVRTVETYLFDGVTPDFERELYGARLRIHLVARLRAEARFDGLDALVAQMRDDVAEARRILAEREPDPTLGAWA
jgi:riboflavin kinase/FMN adenylyltransferase